VQRSSEAPQTGLLIINADDWGRDPENTGKILDCVLLGAVSSVSAMVFMEDSERAAAIAGNGKSMRACTSILLRRFRGKVALHASWIVSGKLLDVCRPAALPRNVSPLARPLL